MADEETTNESSTTALADSEADPPLETPLPTAQSFSGADSATYCGLRTGESAENLPDTGSLSPEELAAFVANPAELMVVSPEAAEASFQALAALSDSLVEVAPAEIADHALTRATLINAFVGVFETLGWEMSKIMTDPSAALTLFEYASDPQYLASMRLLAEYEFQICNLRATPSDLGQPETALSEVPDNLLPQFEYLAAFSRHDFDSMIASTKTGSPAAVYAEFRRASSTHLGAEGAIAYRPVLMGTQLLACDGQRCADYTEFEMSGDRVVSYSVNALPLTQALARPVTEFEADGVRLESIMAYVDTADQLQLVLDVTSDDYRQLVLEEAMFVGRSSGQSVARTVVPEEGAAPADVKTRLYLVFQPRVRLPGVVTITFDDGVVLEVPLEAVGSDS